MAAKDSISQTAKLSLPQGTTKQSGHRFPDRECFLKSMVKVQMSRSDLQPEPTLPVTLTAQSRHGCLSRKPLATAGASLAFSSSAPIPTSHPFRPGMRKPLLSQGRITWVSPDSHPFPEFGCQEKRWQEASSTYPLSATHTPQGNKIRASAHLLPVTTHSKTPLPESLAALAGAWPGCGFTQCTRGLPCRHSSFLSRQAQASAILGT